ncbi:hypothetical protein KBI33_01200 [Candidatus Shapirobacteria bacterium]|nr:hypothetical protein [Candidatus Shapirobacteria bacterium]
MRALIFLIAVLVIFGLPVFLFAKSVKRRGEKRKASVWEGKLVDKKHLEWEDDDSPYTKDLYTLYFETNDGKKVEINVEKKIYDQWEIGNQAKKESGEPWPQKVS